jgi:small subunit ribosomal protein S6
MNKYEIVYIFRSSLASEELESKLENFHSLLTRDAGQISAVEHWGKRQLAYPIEKERNGNYVVAQFETEPASLPDFERILKLDEQILRYLIVISEGELPIPPSMRRESDDRPGSGYGAAPRGSSTDAASKPDAEREPAAGGEDAASKPDTESEPAAGGEDADAEPDTESEDAEPDAGGEDADDETESESEVTAEEAPEEEERPPTDVASDAEELAAPVDEAGEAEEAEERSSSDA